MQVNKDFADGVIETVSEGAVAYWAIASDYNWDATEPNKPLSVRVREFEEPNKEIVLDREAIQRGIDIIASQTHGFEIGQELFGAILWGARENDSSFIDRNGADCIVQAAMFGELVYG